jgi:anaerobic magnesium-protoporphyrin IX monomethyl ester cyclase
MKDKKSTDEYVDVLFVNPPSPDGRIYIRDIDRSGRYSREDTIWPQSNLAYLAAAVSDKYSVDLVDCIAEKMDWPAFKEYVNTKKPRYIVSNVISSIVSNDTKVGDIAHEINARLIAIGPHVTALPKESLHTYPGIDYVIIGEAEESLRELIDAVESGKSLNDVKGIGYRNENKIAVITEKRPPIEDLNSLTYPRHDLLPLEKYSLPLIGRKYTFVMTSRGCPFNCTFCRSPVMWGKKVRKRSPENIIGELKELKLLGIDNIIFHSDTFTLDKKWTLDLCQKIIDEKLNIRWIANSRANTIDKEMLARMKKAGCWMIAYGFESGSQDILDLSKKEITIDQIRNAARWTDEAGIKIWGYFIIGLPGETKETINQTIKLAKELPIYIANFAIGAPYPGTEFFRTAKANNWLVSEDWEKFDQNYSAVVNYESCSSDDIVNGVRRSYKEYYLNPLTVIRIISSIRSIRDINGLCKTGFKHIKMIYGYDK